MQFLKDNKKILIACTVCLAVGLAAGKHFGAKEKVVTKEVIKEVIVKEEVKNDTRIKNNTEIKEGPVKETIVIKQPDGTVIEKVIETGPKETKSTTDTASNTEIKSETKTKEETKVVEHTSPRPNWSLGVQSHWSFDDLIHQSFYKFKPQVSGGYRLVGSVWIELSSTINPTSIKDSTIGLGARVEF